MMTPAISVILCTARPDYPYVEHPTWHVIGKIVHDLTQQTFSNFELVIVDAIDRPWYDDSHIIPFAMQVVKPRSTVWTRARKVAISAYRNTGLIHARGGLVVNLDDCCELPADYLATIWQLHKAEGVCVAPCGWDATDKRPQGRVGEYRSTTGDVRPVPSLYGFNSFPLAAALAINGYDETYDGSQGLEDVDFNIRLHQHGLALGLLKFPGFRLHKQSAYDPRAVDLDQPIVKCPNLTWKLRRDWENNLFANTPFCWAADEAAFLMPNDTCSQLMSNLHCRYHKANGADITCPWVGIRHQDFMARGPRHELYDELVKDPPVVDLLAERKKVLR